MGVFEHAPVPVSHVSVVQALLSLQSTLVVQPPLFGTHVPASQVPLPPMHGVAAGTFVVLQPVTGSHALVVHSLLSSQAPSFGVATQPVAGLQLSVVHATPSSQVTAACVHAPVPVSHVSVVQASLSSQSALVVHGPLVGTQVPLWQVPAPLMHAVPSATTAFWQPVLTSQVSVVHSLLSSHAASFAAAMQPLAESQLSVVHATPSSHVIAEFVHAPVSVSQVSIVQASLSLQSASLVHLPLVGTQPPL